jgi:ABC-type Fe3+-citrate transport system substrate-binding protein
MSKSKVMMIVSMMIVFVMLVSACQQATPTQTTAPATWTNSRNSYQVILHLPESNARSANRRVAEGGRQ